MKKILLLSCIVFVAVTNCYAQNPVPNASFENWTGGLPDNWSTLDLGGFITITQSADVHSGSLCARGDVDTIFGTTVPPFLLSIVNDTGKGFAVSQNYTTLEFWYKMNGVAGDVLDAVVGMSDNTGAGIAIGGQEFGPQSSYTHAALPIFYTHGATAAKCMITIGVVAGTGDSVHLGSYIEIDDVSLTNNPTGIEQSKLTGIQSLSVYPNPAKGQTTLSYSIENASSLKITLYSITGKKVFSTSHFTTTGRHQENLDLSKLNSGIYLCTLQTGNNLVQKMISVLN
jgi:hypothetical protein